jgi:hypothetical protein
MKLCKVMWTGYTPGKLDNYGEQSGACGIIENYWDVQNDHVSYDTTYHDPSGNCVAWDSAIPPQYRNVQKYATPGGLSEIMR